jgi:hypothetical protein
VGTAGTDENNILLQTRYLLKYEDQFYVCRKKSEEVPAITGKEFAFCSITSYSEYYEAIY